MIKKLLIIIGKTVACLLAVVVMAISVTSYSPVYFMDDDSTFAGPDIYNPYHCLDTANLWKRANFHTHTRVEGILNECEYWPDEVYERLEKLGYDIVTFSNHNELTVHPFDPALQVNVYEHGFNLLKYHKLAFGAEKVWHYDHLLPLFPFQKQFQIEHLRKGSDIVQINHPLRTPTLSDNQIGKLSGYTLMELDSGKSTENTYWDRALSHGHYSFGVANDDLHYPDRSSRIGVRCCFLYCRSATYKDIKECLSKGSFYSMRVPDYGHGDWETKYEKNRKLPSISDIGLKGSTVYISLSTAADSIKVTGQNHKTLTIVTDTDNVEYTMQPEDTYARITAYFPEGEVIYTNPFARYDASVHASPFDESPTQVNITMTILFNLILLLICLADAFFIYKLFDRRRK